MKNHKLIMTGIGKSEIRTEEMPELAPDEVLLRVEACALCTWERFIYNGDEPAGFPFHGGHEIAGTVVSCGSSVSLPEGMPAAVVSWARCNACDPCRRGFDNHCVAAEGHTPPGEMWGPEGFAEYIIVKNYEVFPLGNQVPIHMGVLAEPLSCVTRSIKRSGITTGETAIVIGAGIMGLLFLKVLQNRGVQVVVVQRSAERRELAFRMGADLVIDPSVENWEEQILSFTRGKGAEAVFYTAGGGSMLNRCLHLAAIGGSILIYAPLYSDQPVLEADPIHFRELSVIGSIRHDKQSVHEAVRLLGSNRLDLSLLRMEFADLKNFDAAVKQANTDRGIHRILLRWE